MKREILKYPFENFICKVEKTETCWIWKGNRSTNGYGQIYCNKTSYRSHRYSYEYFKGEIPEGMVILHSCDNKICVNPDHLSVGTMKENIHDAIKKKRFIGYIGVKGTDHSQCKLTEKEVLEIRSLREQGVFYYNIAKIYNINKAHVHDICKRKYWKHV